MKVVRSLTIRCISSGCCILAFLYRTWVTHSKNVIIEMREAWVPTVGMSSLWCRNLKKGKQNIHSIDASGPVYLLYLEFQNWCLQQQQTPTSGPCSQSQYWQSLSADFCFSVSWDFSKSCRDLILHEHVHMLPELIDTEGAKAHSVTSYEAVSNHCH